MDPNNEPCVGCIYYDSGKSQFCAIQYHVCPFGPAGFKRTGDIKNAMLAWNLRGLIRAAGKGNNFSITISVRKKKVAHATRLLSAKFPLGTKFKVKTLPWWRCWFRKVAII